MDCHAHFLGLGLVRSCFVFIKSDMLLPFLPLLLAVMFLSWVQSQPIASPDPLLGWPLPVVLCGIVTAGTLLAQGFRKVQGGLENTRRIARFDLPRMAVLGLWAASVKLEVLHLRLAEQFPEAFADEGAFSVLILTYWLADALVATPVSRWNAEGRRLKLAQVQSHLRLQLPLLILGGGQALLLLATQAIPWFPGSGMFGSLPELLSIAVLLILAPPVIMGCWNTEMLVESPERTLIEKELHHAGTAVASIRLWPEEILPSKTAGVIGFLPKFRYLLISPGLLSSLSEDELRAVVAHEAGHLRRSHLLFFAVALFGFMELLLLGAGTASVVSWWQGWEIPLWAEGVVMVAALLGFLRFGVGFLSRQFERQADCHALERVGLRPFGQALLKVSWLNGIDPETPNWHHYGVLQRLRFLSECEAQPELRERHHQWVLHLKGALLAGALLLLGVNAYFTSADARIRLLGYYLTSVSSTAEPTLAPLMVRLADLLYFEKELGQAESWYRKSLVLNADSPRALNNLAWLLTERYGDSSEHMRESVLLAQQALEQDEQAFIWDTLAEGHWQLGQRQQALEAAEHAWFLADSRNPPLPEAKLRYYKERLEVFRGR